MSVTMTCLVAHILLPHGWKLRNGAASLSTPPVSSHGPRRWPLRINSIGGDRLGNLWFRHHPFVGQRLERCDHHVVAVYPGKNPRPPPGAAATGNTAAEAKETRRPEPPAPAGGGRRGNRATK